MIIQLEGPATGNVEAAQRGLEALRTPLGLRNCPEPRLGAVGSRQTR